MKQEININTDSNNELIKIQIPIEKVLLAQIYGEHTTEEVENPLKMYIFKHLPKKYATDSRAFDGMFLVLAESQERAIELIQTGELYNKEDLAHSKVTAINMSNLKLKEQVITKTQYI